MRQDGATRPVGSGRPRRRSAAHHSPRRTVMTSKVTEGHYRSPEVTSDYRRSPQGRKNHRSSPVATTTRCRSLRLQDRPERHRVYGSPQVTTGHHADGRFSGRTVCHVCACAALRVVTGQVATCDWCHRTSRSPAAR